MTPNEETAFLALVAQLCDVIENPKAYSREAAPNLVRSIRPMLAKAQENRGGTENG